MTATDRAPATLPLAPPLPDGLDTPCLVVDLDAAERNAQRMADGAAARGVLLRPHAKTHKSIALARLQPDARTDRPRDAPQPAVTVLASARSDVSDEIDVRGTRAQEAREAVRSFVDDAALAGLAQVRVVHGRGTGAVRTAVRDELDRHPLVESHETDSADGATVVHLAR